jgi:hypothetical protein
MATGQGTRRPEWSGTGCLQSHLQPDPQLLSTGISDAWHRKSADDVHLVVERRRMAAMAVAMAVVAMAVVVRLGEGGGAVMWLQRKRWCR